MDNDFGFDSSAAGANDEVENFLAREQQSFAELNGDGGDFGFGAQGTDPEFGTSDFGSSGGPTYDLANQFGVSDGPAAVDSLSSSHSTVDPYAAVSSADSRRAEPESIRKWREEQKARLEEMDALEQTHISEWKDQAKHELEEWYKQYHEQIGKNKNNNRVAEEEMLKVRDSSNTEDGASWARISDMCDFNHKNHKATKDVSRMRTLLINLKQNPPANVNATAS